MEDFIEGMMLFVGVGIDLVIICFSLAVGIRTFCFVLGGCKVEAHNNAVCTD